MNSYYFFTICYALGFGRLHNMTFYMMFSNFFINSLVYLFLPHEYKLHKSLARIFRVMLLLSFFNSWYISERQLHNDEYFISLIISICWLLHLISGLPLEKDAYSILLCLF